MKLRASKSRGRRGQVAIEYLLVVMFAFIMIIPLIIAFYSESARFHDEVTSAQITQVKDALLKAVEEVYYLGPPSKQTLSLRFPEQIKSTAVTGDTIIFTVMSSSGTYELVGYAVTDVSGAIGTFDGIHTITVIATETSVLINET
ncbi:hypothetical protein GOV10_04610 [Candidatus Woesearchaeota archaeon]|nr:hypothetical protein [Candidatus Woesearchaeota archaeon]